MILKLFLFICVKMFVCKAQPEVLLDLKPLLETQKNVISDLESIVQRKKRTLSFLEKELNRYIIGHDIIMKSSKNSFINSVNYVTFLKRLSVDLDIIEDVINEDIGLKKRKCLTYPSKQDYAEAVLGIFRIQTVYGLNVTQLADGILNTNYNLPMTAFDCYDIGQVFLSRKLLEESLPWFMEAHRLYKNGHLTGLTEVSLVSAVCNVYHALDDNENFIKWSEELIKLKPNTDVSDVLANMDLHRARLETKITKEKMITFNKVKPLIDPAEEVEMCKYEQFSKGFKTLCRNEMSVGSFIAKRLKCWYHSGYHPFTRLAPFKVEQLYVKPDIFLFYEVLHDAEIGAIVDYVTPTLMISKIGKQPYTTIDTGFRKSKSSLLNSSFKLVKKIDRRIADLTGLNLSSSEIYQVHHYEVWDYFSQHVDFWRDLSSTEFEQKGNRLATTLIYMSDAKQGGATVFTALGLSVFPVKGAALFWFNLLPSGDGDDVTCHGACPVIRGDKWVLTKWLRSSNQELFRPCTTQFQSRRPHDIPYPEAKILE